MELKTIMSQGWKALERNRLRSVLTILGIAIGIAAVVCVVALGSAGSEQIMQRLENLGENLVWIEAGGRNVSGVRTGTRGTKTLVVADMEAILREIPLIRSCSPQVDSRVQVVYGNQNWSTTYRGVAPEYLTIRRWTIAEGTAFGLDAVERNANVCLLGDTVRRYLFANESPIGATIRIQSVPFTVMGTLAPKGASGGGDQDDTIFLPYSTGMRKIAGVAWLDDIMCSAVAPELVKSAGDQAAALLRERHRILPGQDDDFNIRNPEDRIRAQLEASQAMAMLLVAIGSVSLLVGGIGIMNVMLVSVTERTREIGVRMAVGATEGQVQIQFLGEAVMLCMTGGAAGVIIGMLGTLSLGYFLGWPMELSLEALATAALFSAAIGLFFGYYPARKAAGLDPIEALRYE
jgi:putative ABC transport system permease protein